MTVRQKFKDVHIPSEKPLKLFRTSERGCDGKHLLDCPSTTFPELSIIPSKVRHRSRLRLMLRAIMEPSHRIDEITIDTIHQLLTSYSSTVPDKLHALDEARYEAIPSALAARDETSLTKQEVATLVDWKLSHGTFRPTLKKLVDQNSDDAIRSTTKTAFESFAQDSSKNIKSSLTTLTQLKGIGPATASLLLSVFDPECAPFFSDELFRWAMYEEKTGNGWDRKIKYNPKEYLELFEKIQRVQERLESVKAVDLERVAYVLGHRGAGKSVAKNNGVEEGLSPRSKDLNLKRKAKDEVDSKSKEESKGTKRAKVSAAKDEIPTKGTRASARVKDRDA